MQQSFTPLPQTPNVIIYKRTLGPVWTLLTWGRNISALIGISVVGMLGFLYFQGSQVVRPFDDKFVNTLGNFAWEILKKDVASAMVIKTPLGKEVTIKQAIQSMKLHASQLNIKFIQSYPLSKEIEKVTGKPGPFVEIFEFCDATVAATLIKYNPDFAIHFPCRIVLYEDAQGQAWLATFNLNLLLHGSVGMTAEAKMQASKFQDSILKIMGAGANGAL